MFLLRNNPSQIAYTQASVKVEHRTRLQRFCFSCVLLEQNLLASVHFKKTLQTVKVLAWESIDAVGCAEPVSLQALLDLTIRWQTLIRVIMDPSATLQKDKISMMLICCKYS